MRADAGPRARPVPNVTAELPLALSEQLPSPETPPANRWQSRVSGMAYGLALAVAVASWFFAIRLPLWLDETISYWQISGGFGQIWARQGLSFPAYSYILWFTTRLSGTSELALRLPSIVAMLAAVAVLYRVAREFFTREIALIVTILFCVHPVVVYTAIDARPYAFGALVINCAILWLLLWTERKSSGYAIAFGFACAFIFYSHYLFGVILAAFALYLLAVKREEWRLLAPQALRALAAFTVGMLPVVPRLRYLVETRQSHVFAPFPFLEQLTQTFAPGDALALFGLALLIAAATYKLAVPESEPPAAGPTCLLLGVVPIAILYGVSTATSLHVFVDRYRLVAVPGIALCWGLLVSRISSRATRLAFTLAVAGLAAFHYYGAPRHGYTWKYALQAANAATADHASLLICSDLPEADYLPLPADPLNTGLFAPLSYYRVNSPVVPLPRALNDAAKSQVRKFLAASPAPRHFVAVAFLPSWPTLRWIGEITHDDYAPRTVGTYDGIMVMEFTRRQ